MPQKRPAFLKLPYEALKDAEKNNDDTAVKIQFSVQELPKTDSVNTPVSVEWLQEQVKSAQSFISVEKKDSSLPSSSSSFQSEFDKQFLHQTSQISSQSSANIFSDDSQSSSVFSSPKKKAQKKDNYWFRSESVLNYS